MIERSASSTGKVQSGDCTMIVYERFGEGPPLVLVGGALTSAPRSFPSFVQLAMALSSDLSVYTYGRRGRGDSADTQPYTVEHEIEDLDALIAEAGGTAGVHGLSCGGVLGLTAPARRGDQQAGSVRADRCGPARPTRRPSGGYYCHSPPRTEQRLQS